MIHLFIYSLLLISMYSEFLLICAHYVPSTIVNIRFVRVHCKLYRVLGHTFAHCRAFAIDEKLIKPHMLFFLSNESLLEDKDEERNVN